MPTAFLFAGQGSQSVGMGSDLASTCQWCAALFARAEEVLDFPLRRAMWEGTPDELRHTAVLQPALLALEVAQARHLAAVGLRPDWLAGHSVGQYSALVVADSLPFEDGLHLVRERGKLMQDAVPDGVGAMASVLGLDRGEIRKLCRTVTGVVGIASHNAPGHTVISGDVAAVTEASTLCREAGASVVELPVSAPFHTALLEPMVPPFTKLVEEASFRNPRIPVIDNVGARPLEDAAAVRRSLVLQVSAPVLFEESLRYLVERGVNEFVQCGPGRSVLDFAKRILPAARLSTFAEAASGAPSPH
ncbi:MAG TPA: ACP S-malonyltransferase [Myxococcales bacterium]|jgi:[acyl-carrier-protein] S-malonyltransferase|nr:ACP S-malonyltransferase [Myxococcales bacterium]